MCACVLVFPPPSSSRLLTIKNIVYLNVENIRDFITLDDVEFLQENYSRLFFHFNFFF